MKLMKLVLGILATAIVLALIAAGLVVTGAISFAADEPHSQWIFHAIETARERSIVARARGIEVPDLDDPRRLAVGAQHYAQMCAGCHLAPGMEETELHAGLYPQPPQFSEAGHDEVPADQPVHIHAHGDPRQAAARQFWIIKHGIKGSGMPAWGKTHDDERLWGLVAFVQRLPEMSEAEYRQLTADGGGEQAQEHRDEPGETGHPHHRHRHRAGHAHGTEAQDSP